MEENKNDLKITAAGIDKDNLVIMKEEDFKQSVATDKGFKRFLLNFEAEMLTLLNETHKEIQTTNDILTMAFSKELSEYYKEQITAIKQEENKAKANAIIEKSHQKSKKIKK